MANFNRLLRLPFVTELGIVTGAALLASLFAVAPARAWLFMAVWGVYLIVFALAYWKTDHARAVLRYALVAVSVLVIADRLTFAGRPDTWINPNAAASLLLLLLPWVDKAASFPMLIGLTAFASTGSRGALWAWIVALIVLIMRPKWYIVLPVALILATGLVMMIRPENTLIRLRIWEEAATLAAQRPWVGWGPGAYPLLATVVVGEIHPDNLLLWIAAEQGMMGMIAWGCLTGGTAAYIRRYPGTPARLALTGWGLHQIFDCTLGFLPVGIAAALCLGVLARHVQIQRTQHDTATSGT